MTQENSEQNGESTPNLGLYKPSRTDRVDISVFNDNADLIDAAFDPASGVFARSYRHEQAVPSDEWTIEHNLGYRPAGVLVADSAGTLVEGAVLLNTETTTVLTFSAAFSGIADLS